jgi:hypothetical protein
MRRHQAFTLNPVKQPANQFYVYYGRLVTLIRLAQRGKTYDCPNSPRVGLFDRVILDRVAVPDRRVIEIRHSSRHRSMT